MVFFIFCSWTELRVVHLNAGGHGTALLQPMLHHSCAHSSPIALWYIKHSNVPSSSHHLRIHVNVSSSSSPRPFSPSQLFPPSVHCYPSSHSALSLLSRHRTARSLLILYPQWSPTEWTYVANTCGMESGFQTAPIPSHTLHRYMNISISYMQTIAWHSPWHRIRCVTIMVSVRNRAERQQHEKGNRVNIYLRCLWRRMYCPMSIHLFHCYVNVICPRCMCVCVCVVFTISSSWPSIQMQHASGYRAHGEGHVCIYAITMGMTCGW